MSIELQPRIVVFGVGGAGGNAVDNMIKAQLQGVEFVVANTDAQALSRSSCENRIQLGLETTSGLGAGARPEVGTAAAEESLEEIDLHLEGAHMVFIAAGMGGGTGTGSAPVIARAARDRGILTVGVVTKPFGFEGKRRMSLADQGLAEIKKHVDTLIIIPNQNLFRVANEQTTFADAFQMADRVLYSGVRGITDLMVMPGLIHLDFADVRTVMSGMGSAMMGTGEGQGEGRAMEAAQQAVANPLLDDISLKGAKGVLINITGGYDMTLYEVDEAANEIRNQVDPEAEIILGSTFDESIEGKMRVSVVATGIDTEASAAPKPEATSSVASFASGLAQQNSGHKPAIVPTVTPEPEPVEEPKPVVQEAKPVTASRPVARIVDESVSDDHVSVDAVFGNTNMGAPPPRTDINHDTAGQRTGLHNLFGWRRPTGDDAEAPFEDVETASASNEDKEEVMPPVTEDADLEIPAFLRRSANH